MEIKKYIKKLGAQELGYRKGKQVTGQYIYVSKDVISFFPKLSQTILNDSVHLKIRTEFSSSSVEASYIWHNNRFFNEKGTRNEYRIYLNRSIATDDYHFQPNDIIVLSKIKNCINTYKLEHIRTTSQYYKKFDAIIESSELKGNHGVIC